LLNRKAREVPSSVSLNNVNDFAASIMYDGNTVRRHVYTFAARNVTVRGSAMDYIRHEYG